MHKVVNLSWHSSFWCLSRLERGNCFRQKVHSVGSSLTAFSTARFLQHRFLLISHLHGHKQQWFIRQCRGMNNICGIGSMVIQVCGHCRGGSSLGIRSAKTGPYCNAYSTVHNQIIFTSVHTLSQECIMHWERKKFKKRNPWIGFLAINRLQTFFLQNFKNKTFRSLVNSGKCFRRLWALSQYGS